MSCGPWATWFRWLLRRRDTVGHSWGRRNATWRLSWSTRLRWEWVQVAGTSGWWTSCSSCWQQRSAGRFCGHPTRLGRSRGWWRPGPFRIRDFQQNPGYIHIYPDIFVEILSPSNVRATRKTLLESSPYAQSPRDETDEHKNLLRAGSCCLQNDPLSESLFRSPWWRPCGGWRR